MKTELKAKFLQHLNQKKQDEGFTLIELLVVIIIIGILAAIAMPSLLEQTAKAKQSEAKQSVGVVNRTQIAYRTENHAFATGFDALAIGTLTGGANATTTNYSYTIAGDTDTASILAKAMDTSLKAYSGGNKRYLTTSNDGVITSVVCEANTAGTGSASSPLFGNTTPSCPSDYTPLN